MIDVWHTLESAFPTIIGKMRHLDSDFPPHPIESVEGWQRLMDFMVFEDQAINGEIVTSQLNRRAYMNPITIDKHFDSLAQAGYATKHDDGTFTVTDAGREGYLDYFSQRTTAYQTVTLLPQSEFDQLIGFLQKGYELAKHADEPDHKPSMGLGHRFYSHVAETGGQLGALLGWINLFELYRDDVHAAVWRDADFTGIRMEVFTHVWHDDEHNASKLAEHLVHRGYSKSDYQTALDELVAFGLITTHDDYYTLTEEGREFRNSIEEDTQAMFQDFCMITFSEDDLSNFARIIEILKNDESND